MADVMTRQVRGREVWFEEMVTDPGSVALLRAGLPARLDEVGLAELTDAAVQIMSELVNNVIVHEISPTFALNVRALSRGNGIVIEVWDDDDKRRPEFGIQATVEDEAGRGLLIVEALADSVGVALRAEGGKLIWAMLKLVIHLLKIVLYCPNGRLVEVPHLQLRNDKKYIDLLGRVLGGLRELP